MPTKRKLFHSNEDLPANDWLSVNLETNPDFKPEDMDDSLPFPEYAIPSNAKRRLRTAAHMESTMMSSSVLSSEPIRESSPTLSENTPVQNSPSVLASTSFGGATPTSTILSNVCFRESVKTPAAPIMQDGTLQLWDLGSDLKLSVVRYKSKTLIHIRMYQENGHPTIDGVTLDPQTWIIFSNLLKTVRIGDVNSSCISNNSILTFVTIDGILLQKTYKSLYARECFSLRRGFVKMSTIQFECLKKVAPFINICKYCHDYDCTLFNTRH